MPQEANIAIIGLGYVGLPLAVAFSKHVKVIGFDTDAARVESLLSGIDHTQELDAHNLQEALNQGLALTHNSHDLASCNVYIVTVPTPINENKEPDLRHLLEASQSVGELLKKGDVVVYESTTFPGCTEEVCVPELEQASGLRFNHDFFCGYSPERINPGDKLHNVTNIVKVTSGSNEETANFVDELYKRIVSVGTHKAPSIRVAEAAKAIENAQRDLNISFMNELALMFDTLKLDTHDVLAAAGTKWNFLPFTPGLVGGHCIGVDPYYLTHKAKESGFQPNVILSGRTVNDSMGFFVADRVIRMLKAHNIDLQTASVDVLGYAFKANCPDTRNTKVADVVSGLAGSGCKVQIVDPWVQDPSLHLLTEPRAEATALVLAVAHDQFKTLDWERLSQQHLIFDVTGSLPRALVTERL